MTGETFEEVLATLRHLAPALLGCDPLNRSTAMRLLGSRVVGVPTAKAALDIALHDLEGMAEVRRLWGVPVMADEAVLDARDALRAVRLRACDLINIKLM